MSQRRRALSSQIVRAKADQVEIMLMGGYDVWVYTVDPNDEWYNTPGNSLGPWTLNSMFVFNIGEGYFIITDDRSVTDARVYYTDGSYEDLAIGIFDKSAGKIGPFWATKEMTEIYLFWK